MAMRMVPQPATAGLSSVGFMPHAPAVHTAPASHLVPHMPQLLASPAFSVQTAAAAAPQTSGVLTGQPHTFMVLQKKPVPWHSAVLVQAPPGITVPPPPAAMPPLMPP